jgi:hypothetical protein
LQRAWSQSSCGREQCPSGRHWSHGQLCDLRPPGNLLIHVCRSRAASRGGADHPDGSVHRLARGLRRLFRLVPLRPSGQDVHPSKGQFAGKPFELLDWQKFVIGSIFGWKLGDIRRFRTAFVYTARKNGKSTIEAGIGPKALIDEGEPGAEVYSAATTRVQARIVFSEAE